MNISDDGSFKKAAAVWNRHWSFQLRDIISRQIQIWNWNLEKKLTRDLMSVILLVPKIKWLIENFTFLKLNQMKTEMCH